MTLTHRIKSLFAREEPQPQTSQQTPNLESQSPETEPKNLVPANNAVQENGGIDVEQAPAGELTFEEDTQGGMGRHLGLWSTTSLMYVNLSPKAQSLSSFLTSQKPRSHNRYRNFLHSQFNNKLRWFRRSRSHTLGRRRPSRLLRPLRLARIRLHVPSLGRRKSLPRSRIQETKTPHHHDILYSSSSARFHSCGMPHFRLEYACRCRS